MAIFDDLALSRAFVSLVEQGSISAAARILPSWQGVPLPANIVYPGQRMLPARVRSFVDFAVSYMTAILNQAAQAGSEGFQ
jgi:DNA-binding transcriptional LysR family regulator